MEKATEAVQNFISKSGHHDTTVDEVIRPAVVEEKIQPIRHEEVTTAVDKKIFQDHYHTTIQPIQDRVVLPEKHEHRIAPVVERSFEHEDKERTRASLDEIAAKFHDTSITHETQRTTIALPTVTGERVHHHVHEKLQPVIYKETIVPQIIHTTVPVHEIHHAPVQHHGTSILPAKSMSEFLAEGGSLKGHEKTDSGYYEGCPHPYNKELQAEILEADRHVHSHIASQMKSPLDRPIIDSALSGRRDIPGTAYSGNTTSTSDTGLSNHTASTNTTSGAHNHRFSLLDKLGHRNHTNTSHTGSTNTPSGSTGMDRRPSAAGTGRTAEQRDEKKGGFPHMNVLK